MTRGISVTLPSAVQVYNLWSLVVGADPTFSNSPYIPKVVERVLFNFPIQGPNSGNNAGNNVSVFVNGAEARNLISGDAWALEGRTDINKISLQGSGNNVQVDILIVN